MLPLATHSQIMEEIAGEVVVVKALVVGVDPKVRVAVTDGTVLQNAEVLVGMVITCACSVWMDPLLLCEMPVAIVGKVADTMGVSVVIVDQKEHAAVKDGMTMDAPAAGVEMAIIPAFIARPQEMALELDIPITVNQIVSMTITNAHVQ